MDLQQANVLITGGSDGIGLGLAKRFQAAGSNVLITGRNADKLAQTGFKSFVSDISKPDDREALAKHITEVMPNINIVINNAGFQRRTSLAEDTATWAERQQEIDALFAGPVHLNHLLLPLVLHHGQEAIIVNVTSGGAYVPQVFAPVYSASKAALHSYTMTLRHALANTACRVVELIPPAVQTSMGSHGAPLEEFCDEVFPQLIKEGIKEVGFGPTKQLEGFSETIFNAGAARFQVKIY